MSSKKLNPFKDFQSDQIQRSSRKIFTAHYACRNAALNLTPVTGTTNGFIFQIINSLIESWGVRLTWFDCKCGIISESTSESAHHILYLLSPSVWEQYQFIILIRPLIFTYSGIWCLLKYILSDSLSRKWHKLHKTATVFITFHVLK